MLLIKMFNSSHDMFYDQAFIIIVRVGDSFV